MSSFGTAKSEDPIWCKFYPRWCKALIL